MNIGKIHYNNKVNERFTIQFYQFESLMNFPNLSNIKRNIRDDNSY